MAELITLDNTNFSHEVLGSETAVLVDFWAPRNGPCQMTSPIVEELADEYAGKAKIARVNVEDHPRLASCLSIRGVPAVMVFRDGMRAFSRTGLSSKQDLVQALDAAIA